MTNLFIDLDDVLADFSGHFSRTFGMEHEGMEDEYFWGLIDSHGTFFRDLPLAPGALPFYLAVRALNPVILTACHIDRFAKSAVQKREWVREHLGDVPMIPSPGSKHKQHYMHAPGDVLIDDYSANIKRWNMARGHGILHFGNFAATYKALDDYLWSMTRPAPDTSRAPSADHKTTSPGTTTDTLTASHLGAATVNLPEEKPFRLTPGNLPNCC